MKTTRTEFGRSKRNRGFTLVELLVVIVIISIILTFVALAALDATRRAEERATQRLITKLEGGLNDRLDALMQNRPDPNLAHMYMAAGYNLSAVTPNNPRGMIPPPDRNNLPVVTERAQVLAWCDYLKRELPDVFFLQSDPNFPINFAAVAYPGTQSTLMTPNGGYANWVLPLGHMILDDRSGGGGFGDADPGTVPAGQSLTNSTLGVTGFGIFGASYANAAGLFKNLTGIQPTGFDGVDNSNPGNNLIDEIGEWAALSADQAAILSTLTANHTHATARAEMLYAILVEGIGPWGSVFSRDEFSEREVQDTDGDGLPEFVDAWGQPLQFFRWPILYHSDIQRGQVILPDPNTANQWDLLPPYQALNSGTAADTATAVFLERERDPLDPNQQLTAPQWWSATGIGGQIGANSTSPFAGMYTPAEAAGIGASGGVEAFERFFHKLTEPISPGGGVLFWDRGGSFARRAYYSKFLILSGGPDKQPGVFLYSDADMSSLGDTAAAYLIANENNAMPFGMDLLGGGTAGFTTTVTIPTTTFSNATSADPTHPSTYDLRQAAQDDISNQNLQSGSAIGGSG